MLSRAFAIVAFSLLLIPSAATAQVVRGQLLNGETGLPLEGAMIVLQGPSGELGTVLSNAVGRFILRAPGPGTYSVRADRIGHATTTSDPFPLSSGDTVDIRLVAEVRAIELEALEVSHFYDRRAGTESDIRLSPQSDACQRKAGMNCD